MAYGGVSGYYDPKYKPTDKDLVCEFRIEPAKGVSARKAAEAVAAESSIGTWTKLSTMEQRITEHLKPHIFWAKGHCVRIAYPDALFENNNVPQILSSIAGNVFGMKDVDALRLEDVDFPRAVLRAHHGPAFGVEGIRKIMRVKERPLVGTIVKPKIGLTTREHAHVMYEAYMGGCDIVKDDENLSNQTFNPFENRIVQGLEARDRAESETGEKKIYMPNITAETKEMLRRAQYVKDHGGEYVMIDLLTIGWSALQTLRNYDMGLVIHAHRAMHAALTRNKTHGISMLTIAKFARLIGVDQLHIGTVVGKMEGGEVEVEEIEDEMEHRFMKPGAHVLREDWHEYKPVFAVCSGGLHPGHIPKLMKMLGNDIVIQLGGGIHGHPSGTRVGATAARQAVTATMEGRTLKEYAKNHPALKAALEKWGK
jgi:ribulose-bisphosphate carboxylase large chain